MVLTGRSHAEHSRPLRDLFQKPYKLKAALQQQGLHAFNHHFKIFLDEEN